MAGPSRVDAEGEASADPQADEYDRSEGLARVPEDVLDRKRAEEKAGEG
jgi:hypothetical protein